MTIKELIASKLRPIGDAIREKDGSTELIPIDDMPQAIRDIQGSATVTKQGSWVGTQVANSGYVEKVYFNTSLSVEEVVSLLEQLTYIEADGENYFILNDTDSTYFLFVFKINNEYAICLADENENITTYFINMIGTLSEALGVTFTGWNPNVANNILYNNTASSSIGDYTVGAENDKLTSLFSTTPFTQETETVTLSGEYDGATLETELVTEWQGTQVPDSGTVKKVYINTSLSVEEVVSILESLEYITNPLDTEVLIYPLSCTKYYNEIDNVTYYQIFETVNGVSTKLFKNISLENGEWIVPSWTTNNNEVAIGYENALETLAPNYGLTLQNDKLTSLFSLTPFTPPNTINIKSLLEEKKLPLEIKVNVESESVNVVKQGGWVGTQVPNSGTVENVYFNTNLTYDEVANILSKLTYFDIDSTISYCWLLDVPSTGESIFAQASTLYGPLEYSLHYIDKDGAWNNIFDDTNLWNSSLLNNSNYISINAEVSDNHALDTVTLTSGLYNNLITELFSSVDFIVEVEDSIVLEGTYDGSTISTNGESAIDITSLL